MLKKLGQNVMTYDKQLDRQDGYRDALRGTPRASTQHGYRQGYDRGLAEKCGLYSPPESIAAVLRGSVK